MNIVKIFGLTCFFVSTYAWGLGADYVLVGKLDREDGNCGNGDCRWSDLVTKSEIEAYLNDGSTSPAINVIWHGTGRVGVKVGCSSASIKLQYFEVSSFGNIQEIVLGSDILTKCRDEGVSVSLYAPKKPGFGGKREGTLDGERVEIYSQQSGSIPSESSPTPGTHCIDGEKKEVKTWSGVTPTTVYKCYSPSLSEFFER